MLPYPQETADLVTFTEKILNGKLDFLCNVFFFFDDVLLILYGINLWKLLQNFDSLSFNYEDIKGLNHFERSNILNRNAVLRDRHFQHRFEFF